MEVVLCDFDWHLFTSCKAARGTRFCIVYALLQEGLKSRQSRQSRMHTQTVITESLHVVIMFSTGMVLKPGIDSRPDQRVPTS